MGPLLAKMLKGLKPQKALGPNIEEAAEQAGRVGLGPDVFKETPPVKPEAPPQAIPEGGVEGELVDVPVPTKETPPGEPPGEPPAPREFEPASLEDTGEFVESVGKPPPLPEEQVSNTNFRRWDTEEEMEAAWDTAAKQIDEEGGAGARMSHDEMIKKAEKAGHGKDPLGWMLRLADDGQIDIATLPGKMIIARQTSVELGEAIYQQAKRIDADQAAGRETSSEDLMQFQVNLTKFRTVQEVVGKLTRTAGQLLGSFNYLAKNTGRVRMAQISETLEGLGGTKTILQKASNIMDVARRTDNALGDLSEEISSTFFEKVGAVVEAFRYNNMLSGFSTSLRNIYGNIAHNTYRLVEAAAGAGVATAKNAVRKARGVPIDPRIRTIRDFSFGLRAASNSFMESMRLSGKWWVNPGGEIGQQGKIETRQQVSIVHSRAAQALEEKLGFFGKGMVHTVDTLMFQLGRKNLSSGDIFFKNMLWRYETHTLAHQVARTEGLTGDALKSRIEEILTKPVLPADVFERGMKEAAVGTHTQQPDIGTFSRRFLQLRNTPGPAGMAMRWAVPFARVLVNIMTWSAKTATIPLHPAFSSSLKKSLQTMDQEGVAYMGRLAVYGSLFNVVAFGTSQNNITGTGRYVDTRTLRLWRKSGWQPMSFRRTMPDGSSKYISFAQIQPFATLVGWMADMTDAVNYYGRDDVEFDAIEMAATSVKTLATGPLEAPFAKGLYDWMGMLFEERAPTKVVKNVVSQYIGPAAWLRDIEKTTYPDRSDTYGDNILDELANSFQSKIPGWSDDLPPRLTVFGEPAEQATPPWSIFPVTVSKYDDIFMALNDNDVWISEPRDSVVNVAGQEVDLLEMPHPRGGMWAFDAFKKILGKERLKALKLCLADSDYHNAPMGPPGSGSRTQASRGQMLQSYLGRARRVAFGKYAEANPGTLFARAYEEKIDQPQQPKPPRHAGMREKIEENRRAYEESQRDSTEAKQSGAGMGTGANFR